MTTTLRILRIDASANPDPSASRQLGDSLIEQLRYGRQSLQLRTRSLNHDITLIDSEWVGANFTAPDERSAAQLERLAFSDELIEELGWADHVVVTTPMYNFGVPASLKAWIDLVCRAGVTFRYGEKGPVGLLDDKPVDIVVTTGGVPLGSPADFVSGYLRQVFSFIGIKAVNIVGADQMNVDPEASFSRALLQIENRYPAALAKEVA